MAFVAAIPALTAIGAGISAVSTVAGGVASRNASDYQAQVASNNAQIAQQNAVRAEQAGNVAAENQGRKSAAQLGALKASQAASGVNINSGSSVDVRAGERETNYLDTETLLQNSELKAYGYRVQGQNFQSESALDTAKADSAIPSAALKATGSLLSSASSIGGKWGGSTAGGGGDPVYPPDDI